jgi:hypothetical protein
MTPFEFIACLDGWNRAHGGKKIEPPSEEEYDEAIREYENAMRLAQVH